MERRLKRKQKGFGIFTLLVILVIVGVVGSTTWFVWQKAKDVTPSPNTPPKVITVRDQDAMRTAQTVHDLYLKAVKGSNNYRFGVDMIKSYLSDDLYARLVAYYAQPQPTDHLNDIVACNFGQNFNDLPLRTFVQQSGSDTTVVKIVEPNRDSRGNLSYNVHGFFYTVDLATDRVTNISCQ